MTDLEEPEIGWIEYFINAYTSDSLINEVMNHIVDWDLTPANFHTKWLDYDWNGKFDD